MEESSATTEATPAPRQRNLGAYVVGFGILCSRMAWLAREVVFAHFFGNSDSADAFKAAIRIPNFLQNLFGEGVLSASFIPVYVSLREGENQEEAKRLAGSIFALLSLSISVLVLIGVYCTPAIVTFITPGFTGEKQLQVIRLVRIFFPGAGLLVMCAWCLGILNSHRKFFLSYTAPVIWNITIIAVLLYYGGNLSQEGLAECAAWGALAGSFLQFAIQFPSAYKLLQRLYFRFDLKSTHVRSVVRNFFPVLLGRGVIQISAYIDNVIASFLPTGALSAFGYAQTMYLLPISLFGMSVSAAELPEMSGNHDSESDRNAAISQKLSAGLERIAFFVVPTMLGYLCLGDVLVGVLFQSGRFTAADTRYVWLTLSAASLALYAVTSGRLYASSLYALRDTKTPLRLALIRVSFATVLACFSALYLPGLLGLSSSYGIAGLSLASAVGGILEYLLLRRAVVRKIGQAAITPGVALKIWGSALVSAVVARVIASALTLAPIPLALASLIPYALTYGLLTTVSGVPEARTITSAIRRRLKL